MRTLATKQPTHDSAKQKKQSNRGRSHSVSPLSTGMPLLQRKCACGGGCPRCQAEQDLEEALPIQTKLKISQPGDKYEQEADRVAAKVANWINTPGLGNLSQPQSVPTSFQGNSEVQQGVFRQAVDASVPDVLGDFETTLNRAKGGGSPLDKAFRAKVEPEMGADFREVKVHTDAEADRLNRSIQAKAFTAGQNIFFRQGEYDLSSIGGQELLAHELTHVVQQVQGLSGQVIQRFCEDCILRELHPMPSPEEAIASDERRLRARALEQRRERLRQAFRQPFTADELRSLLERLSTRRHEDMLSRSFFDVLAGSTREEMRRILRRRLEFIETREVERGEEQVGTGQLEGCAGLRIEEGRRPDRPISEQRTEEILEHEVVRLRSRIPARDDFTAMRYYDSCFYANSRYFNFRGRVMRGGEVNYYFVSMAMTHWGYSWLSVRAVILGHNLRQATLRLHLLRNEITPELWFAAEEGFNDELERLRDERYPVGEMRDLIEPPSPPITIPPEVLGEREE